MKKVFFLILLLSFLKQEGLAQTLYPLSQLNMPLPSNKFQFIAEVYTGINTSGANLCFSVSDHAFVIASLYGELTVEYNEEYPHINSSLNSFLGDIGGGYYNKFSHNGVFELIAGAGQGNASFSYEYYDSDFPGNSNNYDVINASGLINHFFVEGDLGYSNSTANIGVGLRFSDIYGNSNYASEDNYKSQFYPPEFHKSTYHANIDGNALFCEPSVQGSIGTKKMKIKVAAIYSHKLLGVDIEQGQGTLYQNFNLTVGLVLDLGRKF